MGEALLQNGELLYHGVKTIKKGRTPHETLKVARRTVLRLINDFRPQVVVVEKTFFAKNRRCALLNVLGDEIIAVAKRKDLKVESFAPSTVKKFICGNGRASKEQVARVVVSMYPRLRVFLTQDRAWKERYHQNMFDAVALGLMALSSKTTRSRVAET